MGQKFRSSLVGWFCFSICPEVAVKIFEGVTRIGGSVSNTANSLGCWPETLVPCHVNHIGGLKCPHDAATSLSQRRPHKRERKGEAAVLCITSCQKSHFTIPY